MIINDTKWFYAKSANPERGFHDYERIIKFAEGTTEDFINNTVNFIKENNNPGWCYFRVKKINNLEIMLETSNDSS